MSQPQNAKTHRSRQRGLWAAVAVLAAAALIGGGVLIVLLRSEGPAASGSSPTATPPAGIGTPIAFKRADTGAPIGTITFHEIGALPQHCLDNPDPATEGLVLRVEIDNTGTVALTRPVDIEVTTVDAAGITHPTIDGSLASACHSQFPRGADPAVGRKTMNWVVLQALPQQVALAYQPIVGTESASIDDLANAFAEVTPASAKLALPNPLPMATTAPAPITVSVEAPEPTAPVTTSAPATTKAAPAAGVGCDPSVDNWAIGADGGQLKCAYAGGPTPKWVNSAPLIGTRTPGTPCRQGEGVAESPSGQTLVCAGMSADTSVWTPGP